MLYFVDLATELESDRSYPAPMPMRLSVARRASSTCLLTPLGRHYALAACLWSLCDFWYNWSPAL